MKHVSIYLNERDAQTLEHLAAQRNLAKNKMVIELLNEIVNDDQFEPVTRETSKVIGSQIPEELHQAASKYRCRYGVSMSEIIRQYLTKAKTSMHAPDPYDDDPRAPWNDDHPEQPQPGYFEPDTYEKPKEK